MDWRRNRDISYSKTNDGWKGIIPIAFNPDTGRVKNIKAHGRNKKEVYERLSQILANLMLKEGY